MGIGDHAAAGLHQRHQRRHLLGIAIGDLRRAHGDHLAVAPEQFQPEGLFTRDLGAQCVDRVHHGGSPKHALQACKGGNGLLDLAQTMPIAEFVQRRAEWRLVRSVIGDKVSAELIDHGLKAAQAWRSNEADHHGMILRDHPLEFAHEVGDWPLMHGRQSTQQSCFSRELRPKAQGAIEIRKRNDAGAPVPCWSQRHFNFRDDGVGAIGVMHQLDLVAADIEDARRLLCAHDFDCADIATVTQHAPHCRPNAAAPASNKPADGGRSDGGGENSQLPAFGARRSFHLRHIGSRLGADDAIFDAQDLVKLNHVKHHAAMQWYALPIIGRAATARRDGYAMLHSRAHRLGNLALVARRNNDLRDMPSQFTPQKRADEELVATFAAKDHGIRRERDVAKILAEGADRMHRESSGAGRACRFAEQRMCQRGFSQGVR